jgi:nucleotide-binding universal stress UspA family protein
MESANFRNAIQDFHEARQRAALQGVLARLTGQSTALLSYEEVYRKLRASGSADRGRREIPLDAIIGSVGRYTDFTRTFLPRFEGDVQRWAGVMAATTDSTGLPPIQVYQIGETYFVIDGHHRVSVARALGATHIEADVVEIQTKVPLTPDVQPEDLILKSEQAAFLDASGLDRTRPESDLRVSEPGQYARLEEHIEVHRYFLENESGRDLPFEEAAARWHDEVYRPIVLAIRERGLLRDFPNRTETDLYLWIVEHRLALEDALGWRITPEAAAADLASKFKPKPAMARLGRRILQAVLPEGLVDGPAPGQWRAARLEARYSDFLFADILVPVSGAETGWLALEQALNVARREQARLQGLHVVPAEIQKDSDGARAVKIEFDRRCEAAGIPGVLALDAGEVARKVSERALLADLVVLNVAYPPAPKPLARLGSGLRAIIQQSARPILAVPGEAAPFERMLLAYDDSPKAKEALFVAAYLAERWKLPLVVLTVLEAGQAAEALDRARAYLEWHEVEADYVTREGNVTAEVMLDVAAERACNLLILGGYGRKPMVEMMIGSSVDHLLRDSRWPLLICR